MLKRTMVILAAAAFFGGAAPTQTAQAGDDIWDLMNPSWWADELFDSDDDYEDSWYYRHYRYTPYWGGYYGRYPRVIVIQQQPETKKQNPEIEPPE